MEDIAKISNIFWGALEIPDFFFFFFWGGGGMGGEQRAYVWRKDRVPP